MNTPEQQGGTYRQLRERLAELEKAIRRMEAKAGSIGMAQMSACDIQLGSEEIYRNTLDRLIEGCQIIDRQWRYRYVNDAVAKQGRRAKEDLLGHKMMEVYPGIEQTEMFQFLQRCMEERVSFRIENEFYFSADDSGWYELSIQPVPEGIFILSLDITDRKRIEQSLARREAEYRALFENSHDAFMTITPPEWKFSTSNRACIELFRARDYEEFTTFSPWELSPEYQPDGQESKVKALEMIAIATREGSHMFQWAHRRLDGEEFMATVFLTRILLREETLFQATVRDITDQIRVEETVRLAQERLIEQQRSENERVQTELERVQEKLIRKTRLAAIGQVAASIAHDLRNPLGAAGNACYFLKHYAAGDKARTQEYIDIITQELMTANDVIDSLLSMARDRKPVKEAVDFEQLVQGVLAKIPAGKQFTCRMVLESEPFLIHVDPIQMRQVVSNLIRNAIQAVQGQGELVIEARSESNHSMLQFHDSGPGFGMELVEHLIEPLVTTKVKGTGLGLTICHQAVERHGGTMALSNHPDGGALITIYLPNE